MTAQLIIQDDWSSIQSSAPQPAAPVGHPVCFRCGLDPNSDPFLAFLAREEGFEDARAYVASEEGTYNDENGHFACDSCWIAIGMPASDPRWVAP